LKTIFTLVLALILSAGTAAMGDNRVTVLASENIRVDFPRLGVAADHYSRADLAAMTPPTAAALVQSIDNSQLVMFGEQTPDAVFKAVFDAPAVRKSLEGLLGRGGTIYVSPVSWSILSQLPPSMKRFLKEMGAFVPSGANYHFDKAHPETPMTSFASGDLPQLALLHQPNDLSQGHWRGAQSVRYWEGFPKNVSPILSVAKSGRAVVLLQQDVGGKGRIIYSFAYSITRMARSPFMENLAKWVFGSSQASPAVAAAPVIRAAMPKFVLPLTSAADQQVRLDGQLDDPIWAKAAKVSLKLMSGKTPRKATQAWVGADKDRLLVAFQCQEPDVSKLKAGIQARDGQLWKEDCVEVVVRPEGGQIEHWIISAGGAIYDATGGNAAWNSHAQAAVARQGGAWSVELAIPLGDLFADGKLPEVFRLNLAREETQLGEISSWVTPIQSIAAPKSLGYATTLDAAGFARHWEATAAPAPAAVEGDWTIWSRSPWVSSPMPSLLPPKEAKPLTSLALAAPGRGHGSAVLLISNPGGEAMTLKMARPLNAIGPAGKEIAFNKLFTLYQAAPRLNSYQQVAFDPLVELGPLAVVTIPGRQTAMIWVDAAGAAAAGDYSASIELVPTTLEKVRIGHVKLELKIWPVSLPDPLGVQVYTFGPYITAKAAGQAEAYARVAAAFHINWLLGNYPFSRSIKAGPVISTDPADYLGHVPTFAQHANIIYSYGMFPEFNGRLKATGFKGQEFDEQWQALFLEWARHWIDALKQAGIGPDRFYAQIEDEPHPERIPLLVKETAFFKKHFPNIRTVVDVATWGTADDLRALAPYIDLWIPNEPRITARDTAAKEAAFYRGQGQFWPYLCATRMDVQPLLAYYRYRGLRDWSLGAQGIALWAFNSWRGDPWAQWDVVSGKQLQLYDECLFYSSPNGPVPSIRAMAFRQGVEDFALLKMLQEQKKVSTPEALIKQLPPALDPQKVLPANDPEVIAAWRRAMIQAIQRGK
jgi:hypothetical protein